MELLFISVRTTFMKVVKYERKVREGMFSWCHSGGRPGTGQFLGRERDISLMDLTFNYVLICIIKAIIS